MSKQKFKVKCPYCKYTMIPVQDRDDYMCANCRRTFYTGSKILFSKGEPI